MSRKINSVSDITGLAEEIIAELHGGETLLLYGELGSGKTTFVQGLAKALGIKEQVTSPTFTLVVEYILPLSQPRSEALASTAGERGEIKRGYSKITTPYSPPCQRGDNIRKLIHVDLYRLPAGEAVREPAVQEILEQADEKDRLTVIEWADRLGEIDITNARHLQFEHGDKPTKRVVSVLN